MFLILAQNKNKTNKINGLRFSLSVSLYIYICSCQAQHTPRFCSRHTNTHTLFMFIFKAHTWFLYDIIVPTHLYTAYTYTVTFCRLYALVMCPRHRRVYRSSSYLLLSLMSCVCVYVCFEGGGWRVASTVKHTHKKIVMIKQKCM